MRIQYFAILLSCLVLISAAAARADFDAGLTAYEHGEFSAAYAEWLPLAEGGDAEAQYRVGRLYGYGEGVPQDRSKALAWYGKAAYQSHPIALHNLGVYHSKGYGVPTNRQTALGYYRQAAELGDITAAAIVGETIWLGDIVPENKVEAVKWLRVAAEGGSDVAQNNLGIAYSEGKGVSQDDEQAAYWLERSAIQGYVYAQGALGLHYAYGSGTEKDMVKAYKWHLISVRAGNWRSFLSFISDWFECTAEERATATRLADAWQPVLEDRKH